MQQQLEIHYKQFPVLYLGPGFTWETENGKITATQISTLLNENANLKAELTMCWAAIMELKEKITNLSNHS
jgi:hypothetical protein